MKDPMVLKPRPFLFVLMPFGEEFDDVYYLGIKAAADEAGAFIERSYRESMSARIHNYIAKADLVVADMSTRNPNVFYAVGYAHALGKETILVAQSADEIPFDLKENYHIIYGDSTGALRDQLLARLRWNLTEGRHRERTREGWKLDLHLTGMTQPLAHAIEDAVAIPASALRRSWEEQLPLRFSVANVGTGASPAITGCYILTPVKGAKLVRKTGGSARAADEELPAITLETGLQESIKQYKLDWRIDRLPVGAFETLPALGLDFTAEPDTPLLLGVRLIVASFPLDFWCLVE